MDQSHDMLIIGGGLAGLATERYARMNGRSPPHPGTQHRTQRCALSGGNSDDRYRVLARRIDDRFPRFSAATRMTDIASLLNFWRHARSWRGAYEGQLPTSETYRSYVAKEIPGVENLYLAGQWVEPGGGVPIALTSGRQLVQILCKKWGRPFNAEDAQ
ncbi:MAG: hypothetical protein AAGF12_19855 [Myxococcota bacterium]